MTENTGRSVSHRVRLVPGDDPKAPSWLAMIQRKCWFFFWRDWFFVDNARRKAMQRAVAAWYDLEQAMHEVDQFKNDNAEAVQFAEQHRKRDGVSQGFAAKPHPREELMPIPSEFGEVRKRYERALQQGNGHGRGRRLSAVPDATKSRYVPDGAILPDQYLEGVDHTILYDAERAKRQKQGQQQQGQKRNRGQQPNQQGQQGQRSQNVRLENDGTQ